MKFKYKSVDEMSIQELIGQLIMVGLPSTSLDEEYKKFISDIRLVTLFCLREIILILFK